MKLLFNVNGVRAAAGKTLIEDLHRLDCDVVGLQETKATPEQVKEALADLQGYHIYAFSAEKKGYSGTAILSKTEPISVVMGLVYPNTTTKVARLLRNMRTFTM